MRFDDFPKTVQKQIGTSPSAPGIFNHFLCLDKSRRVYTPPRKRLLKEYEMKRRQIVK
ncbi:MAG: hypothetical protein QOD84_2989, partial [Acidobacteriaceae bacterium]